MRLVACALFCIFAPALLASDQLSQVRSGLQNLSIDQSQIWRVRELEFSKGGAKVYLSEGVLAFATPVAGRRVAAVFTTTAVEAGDAELIALPPVPAERASLARFTKSPNLDEHFSSAVLFFTDTVAQDLLNQIQQRPLRSAPDLAANLSSTFNDLLRKSAQLIDVRITQSILDHHPPQNSFFFAMLAGRSIGIFDFIYQPDQIDSVVLGRVADRSPQETYFQMWSAYHPRDLPLPPTVYHLTGYHIDTTIRPDLSMHSTAAFDYQADADDGSVITLLLTPKMRVTSASIDGAPAAVVVHDSPLSSDPSGASTFLLVNDRDLPPGSHHQVTIDYEGSVIHRTSDGNYFVDDRNVWYPFMTPMQSHFDLTFHTPQNLRLVSTGEPVSEEIVNGQRTVHRRTLHPQVFAGFNLGEFTITSTHQSLYNIDICSNPQIVPAPDLGEQTEQILQYFTARWLPLSLHTLSVTPIEGYFGQGFPGLIYLSNISYLRERDRPLGLRNASLDSFFSQLLLPHELAHQWWGNLVTPADYHANWIVEAMSNYAALQYLEHVQGRQTLDAVLAGYRADLTTPLKDGLLIDDFGPVTFDQRLLNNFGLRPWHDILYEKGTWIFHMLRQRMGDAAFHDFQLAVLKEFADRPLSNEELRLQAARFLPAGQPDRPLTAFFDTWVYGTGIPALAVKSGNLVLSGVPDSFSVDVPLACRSESAKPWLRTSEGAAKLPPGCSLPSPANFLYKF